MDGETKVQRCWMMTKSHTKIIKTYLFNAYHVPGTILRLFSQIGKAAIISNYFLRHEDWNLEKLVNNLPKLKWPEAGPLRCWSLFWKPLTVPPDNFWREKLGSSPVLCSCVLSIDTTSYEMSRVCVWRGVPGVWGGRQPRLQGMKQRGLYQQFRSFFHSFCLLILRPFTPSLPLQMPPLLSPAATHFFSSPSPLHSLLWLVLSSPLLSPLPSMSPHDLPIPLPTLSSPLSSPSPPPPPPTRSLKSRAACCCHGNTSALLQPFPGSQLA